jgi:gamma-glutamyltranspeptidase/glutathione hydrolase
MRRTIPRLLVTLPLLVACSVSDPAAPGVTAAPDLGKRVVAEHGVVSSALPQASEAGVDMLRQGGNAVDAAVATAFALGVGEPQMSGLGGGGSMLIWLQDEGRAEYLDFYSAQRVETWRGLEPLDSGAVNLRVVAIPGEVAGLVEAHERYGRLPLAQVMEPAIRLAEDGFPVNQILADMIASSVDKLAQFPATAALYLPGGTPVAPGDVVRNPELAAALRRVADQGRAGFYQGETAESLVRVMNQGGHPVSMADLAAFEPQWKRPLCTDYRGYTVLSAPPPQTGLQLVHTLNLLESRDLAGLGYPTRSPEAFDVVASAIRVANTDNRVNSDPNWSDVPVVGVTSKAFAAQRASLIGTGRAAERIPEADATRFQDEAPPAACAPLDPWGAGGGSATTTSPRGPASGGTAGEGGETTHLSVVDADGNAVALTRTNSSTFGSGALASGFFLNNSGIDFSARDPEDAEAVGRNPWRIRNSTIAPTIVLEDGRAKLVVGAPGGGRIQSAILQTMIYVLDYGLDPMEAVRMPRIYPSSREVEIETENGFQTATLGEVRRMGYVPTPDASGYARVYVIAREGDRWVGAADPRHNGGARGY